VSPKGIPKRMYGDWRGEIFYMLDDFLFGILCLTVCVIQLLGLISFDVT